MHDHTCYYDALSSDCPACKEDFDASPAGVVTKAAEAIGEKDFDNPLGDLLQHLADEMSDEHAEEREFPNHIPGARWLVCEQLRGEWRDRDRWTAALAVARHMLGLPDPNAVKVAV